MVVPWFVVVDVVVPMLWHPCTPYPRLLSCASQGGHFPRFIKVDLDQIIFLFHPVISHFEDHPHVVGGAVSPHPPVQVPPGGGGDEIIVLSRLELQAPWGGTERPERYGEVHEAFRLVTYGHYFRSVTGHSARLELLLRHAVHHVLLLGVLGADQVELVILPREVPVVDIHDVICVVDAEEGICRVPINFVNFCQGFTCVG